METLSSPMTQGTDSVGAQCSWWDEAGRGQVLTTCHCRCSFLAAIRSFSMSENEEPPVILSNLYQVFVFKNLPMR